ncbi:hypothetical protein B0T17DRAFT_613356 [Bombardia bombarda]|uniref:Uncharacterized protein n=1 Tax=Bombardia bombarda TaxID=252184 RepID=A0AA39XN14_9PEZI|nr:hypothetical protein B0T17DRAFT_613356 [Bombardia bombarda]
MESLMISLKSRLRVADPKTIAILDRVDRKLEQLDSLAQFDHHFSFVLYVRLARHERHQLESEVFRCGYRDYYGERDEAEDLASEPTPAIEDIARLLFLKWSWAVAVRQQVIVALEDLKRPLDGQLPCNDIVDVLRSALSTRYDEILPGDRRRQRVEELLSDEVNSKFLLTMETEPLKLAEDLTGVTVAPHTDDLRVWRLLAYQVSKKHHVMWRWPGLHSAAARACDSLGGEHPFYEDWHHELDNVDMDKNTDRDVLTNIAEIFNDNDVWDVWIVCRMLSCETASRGADQTPGTERDIRRFEMSGRFQGRWKPRYAKRRLSESVGDTYDFLQRKSYPAQESQGTILRQPILSQYLHYKRRFPLLNSRDFIPFADYSNFSFWTMDSQSDVAADLLKSLDIEKDDGTDWDLVCLESSKRDPLNPASQEAHLRHCFYVSDDMLRIFPDAHHDDFSHLGGNIIFNRRKLEDTSLYETLDRFWTDWVTMQYQFLCFLVTLTRAYYSCQNTDHWCPWISDQNDCLLIMGRGEDDDLQPIDGDTIYILETLPGLKARRLMAEARNEDGDLFGAKAASRVRSFFDLK